jgi:hypothetical protein
MHAEEMPHDRWGKALWGKTGWLPLEGTVGQNALKLLRWPICGALTYGWPWRLTERLNVELPSKGRRTDGEGRRAHLCLQSEAAAERQIVHDVLSQPPAVIASSRVADPLDEQMHLTLPLAGQLVVNECALALFALRATPSTVAPASAVSRALVQLTLPRTDVEAFDRLEEPAGAGVRAHLWQHRRPFFLVRLRAPGSVLSQLPLDLFELVLKEFIGTGYRASVYA